MVEIIDDEELASPSKPGEPNGRAKSAGGRSMQELRLAPPKHLAIAPGKPSNQEAKALEKE